MIGAKSRGGKKERRVCMVVEVKNTEDKGKSGTNSVGVEKGPY